MEQHHGHDRYGDRDIAEVGEEVRETVPVDEGVAEAFVHAGEGPADDDLPGDQCEQEGRKTQETEEEEEGRRPRNRGGSSGAAVRIGVPRAPGGLGRAAIRSVRRFGAGSSGCVREGTTRAKLGRPRPGVTHSPLWAGCISHLLENLRQEKQPRQPESWPHSYLAHVLHAL
ncbi:hypothetical protein GCM10023083_14760 [Streptomyces phyllanthi]